MEKKKYEHPEAHILTTDTALCGTIITASAASRSTDTNVRNRQNDDNQHLYMHNENCDDTNYDNDTYMQNIIIEEEEEAEFFDEEDY